MENENEMIDALIERMEKSGATIDGLKNIVAAIEKRKAKLDEAKPEDKRIEIVRKTISSEAEKGIVLAAYADKNSLLTDSVFYVKGEPIVALSMLTTALLDMLDEIGVSIDRYIVCLQIVSDKKKKK